MMVDLATIARALGGEVRAGQVLCPGPGHTAADRSLAIKIAPDAPDGFIVFSHAGDDPILCKDYVRQKVGLPEPKPKPRARTIAEYVYRDESGVPFLRVLRQEPKRFLQQHWTGLRWEWGKPTADPIPYRLPEMLEAEHDTVFVVEGEKDADRLAALGLVATTSAGGAGKWRKALNKWFESRIVYILQDNDEPGRQHAVDVSRNLAGVAREVRVVALPGLPDKGDVSDWLNAGGTADRLIDLCEHGPAWEPPADETDRGDGARATEIPGVPQIISAAALRSKTFPPISYVVPGYLVEGCTILAGRPKLGKSWLMLDIGLAVARGGQTLGSVQCDEGDVLYIALEDNERRLQSRMTKILGAFQEWPARFEYATQWPRADDGGIEHIRRWIAAAEKPRLIVVDVLAAFRSPRGRDATLYESDYSAVKALQQIPGETGVAIVVVHHLRKSGAESDPFEKVSGTLGLSGAADTVLVLDRDGNGATLYGRGRDIEEIETAVEFDRQTCRWRVLGEAAEVRRTDERAQILSVLIGASEPMAPKGIAIETGMARNNVDQLLYKIAKTGEILKAGRGRYIHASRSDILIGDGGTPPDKNDKK